MNIVKIDSNSLDKTKRRIMKFLRLGKSDVRTAMDAAPYGVDSNAIKNTYAIYSQTGEKGKDVIVGYIVVNRKADVGEVRLFSTDENGEEKFYVLLANNGTLELGGDSNYAVKFNELKTEFEKLKTDHNNFLIEYKAHIHVLTLSAGTGTAAPPVSTQTPNTSDIDNAKNEKIKTI